MDTTIDPENPLPSTAVKGLLKSHLRHSLRVPEEMVASIFHSEDDQRWVFSDGRVQVKVNAWTRVQVDDDGRSAERLLMVGEQAFAETGELVVTWVGRGPAPEQEVRALRAAARCVTSLGSHRRRGLGWVSLADNEPWTEDDSRALQGWIAAKGHA